MDLVIKNRFVFSAAVAAVAFFAFSASAHAATFTNLEFENGDNTVSCVGGSTVNGTFRLVVPNNQVVEWVQTDVITDNLAQVDTSVGGTLGLEEGTHLITLPIKCPPNTGNYTVKIQGAGIYGGIRAVNGDDTVVAPAVTFNQVLRVTSSSSNTSTGFGTTNNAVDALAALVASLTDKVNALLHPATTPPATTPPATPNKCAVLNEKLAGTMDNTYNEANVRLQGFLLSEGASIPALKAGASFGYKGPQTNSALAWYRSANSCY